MRLLATCTMLICAATAGWAQDKQETLSLPQAIERAVRESARLAEFEARQAGAAAAETGRAAARMPVVSAQAGYTRTNHVEEFFVAVPGQAPRALYPDVPNNYRTRIDLQWPIYTAGRLDALERAAKAETQATGADLEAARADLRLEVTRAFWAVATARETKQVVLRSLQNLHAHIDDLRVRLEQGLIPPNDLLTAEAQRARQQVASLEAENTRATAESNLQRLIALPRAIPELVTGSAPTAAPEYAIDRPELRAFEFRIGAARERETAVQRLFMPQLAVAAGYDYARPNPRIFPRTDRWEDSWDVSVNLSWTLWDGGRRAAEQAEAAAVREALEFRRDDFARQIILEFHSSSLEVETALAAIAASAEGIAAAVEARRVVAERYRAGVATSSDVLDAELAVLQAELDRTRAIANARLAEARLARAAGR